MGSSPPIAALAMYDWPEVAWANDAVWRFVRQHLVTHGVDAPADLIRDHPYYAPWRFPNLLLAQTCGYPYATELRSLVQLVATPGYAVDGCAGGNYCSMVIAGRATGICSLADLGQATAAINSEHSQSGHWALRAAIACSPGAVPPQRALLSGGHRESLAMVAAGKADIAAMDAVCWALAQRHEPDAVAKLRIIARAPMAPGLPLITAASTPPSALAALRSGLQAALLQPNLAEARTALFLSSIEVLPNGAYGRILELRALALKVPFPTIEIE